MMFSTAPANVVIGNGLALTSTLAYAGSNPVSRSSTLKINGRPSTNGGLERPNGADPALDPLSQASSGTKLLKSYRVVD